MEQESFGFPSSFAPRLTATHIKGGARPSSTDLVLRIRHRPGLRSASTLATCDLVSHLLLGVAGNDRPATLQMGGHLVVDPMELAVTIGMLWAPSAVLALA